MQYTDTVDSFCRRAPLSSRLTITLFELTSLDLQRWIGSIAWWLSSSANLGLLVALKSTRVADHRTRLSVGNFVNQLREEPLPWAAHVPPRSRNVYTANCVYPVALMQVELNVPTVVTCQ